MWDPKDVEELKKVDSITKRWLMSDSQGEIWRSKLKYGVTGVTGVIFHYSHQLHHKKHKT